jgi:tetratricopeptide (TPR) repeat protein
MRGYFKIEQ